MGKRPGMLVAVGAVLLIVGAVIVFMVLGGSDDKGGGDGPVQVMVATASLPMGEDASAALASGKISLQPLPQGQVAPGAITSGGALQGQKLAAPLGSGDQVTVGILQAANARPSTIVVPKGRQAVAVTADYTAAGGGYVTVGDKVSLYSLIAPSAPGSTGVTPYARLLIPSAEVLDVSAQTLPTPSAGGAATPTETAPAANGSTPQTLTLLLSLTPQEAEKVAFATTFDKLYFGILAKGEKPGETPGVGYGHNYVGQP